MGGKNARKYSMNSIAKTKQSLSSLGALPLTSQSKTHGQICTATNWLKCNKLAPFSVLHLPVRIRVSGEGQGDYVGLTSFTRLKSNLKIFCFVTLFCMDFG